MKTAIMQPYFFPYIGYYQLINAVDLFVFLDDVNYIKKGWINRNNILLNGEAHLFTISIQNGSQNKLICDTQLNFSLQEKLKFLNKIKSAYKKAPYFQNFYPVLEQITLYENEDLTNYLVNSFKQTLSYLKIERKILLSSHIEKDNSLKAQNKIIDICKKLHTDTYINPIGGIHLYDGKFFEKNNIQLKFIKTISEEIKYKQFDNNFIENLSFIDLLMFNSVDKIKFFLEQFNLKV
jgi:hypothetical protein